MVGAEMVEWMMQQGSLVHSRNQAVGMWQALLEEGVIVHGKCYIYFKAVDLMIFRGWLVDWVLLSRTEDPAGSSMVSVHQM